MDNTADIRDHIKLTVPLKGNGELSKNLLRGCKSIAAEAGGGGSLILRNKVKYLLFFKPHMRPIKKKTEVSNPMVQLFLYIDNRNKLDLIVRIAQKIAEQNFESRYEYVKKEPVHGYYICRCGSIPRARTWTNISPSLAVRTST
jgi:hypothetical protein